MPGDAGDGDGVGAGDWEVSQELPEVPGAGDGGADGSDTDGGTDGASGGDGENATADASGDGEDASGGGGDSDTSAGDALAQALGDFDGEILRERLAAERRAAAAATGDRLGGGTGEGQSTGESAAGPGQRSAVPKAPVGAPKPPTPPVPDTPDARDDDVVARQIREAAEKETDPELKEELWKEYERYKAGR